MRCEEFEQALHEAFDRANSPKLDAQLTEHAASCPTCRQQWLALSAVVEATERLVEPTAPADLASRVLGELHAAPVTLGELPTRHWSARIPQWAALAASLLIAALGGYRYAHLEARQIALAEQEAAVNRALALRAEQAQRGESWQVDPRWLLPQLVQWTPQGGSPGVSPAAAHPAVLPVREDQLRSSLAPVANSTSSALDNLWQALSTAASEENRS